MYPPRSPQSRGHFSPPFFRVDVPGTSIHSKDMDSPLDEAKMYGKAIEHLESCLGHLHDQAALLADDYLSFVDHVEGKSTGWESRSALQLSCTRKGNHLDLKWTGVKWYGPKNARTSIRIAIKRNAELAYTAEKLKVYAKSWEIDKVIETEKQLHIIRRKAKHLVKAIISVRNAMRVSKAANAGDLDDAGQDGTADD